MLRETGQAAYLQMFEVKQVCSSVNVPLYYGNNMLIVHVTSVSRFAALMMSQQHRLVLRTFRANRLVDMSHLLGSQV